jgi:hypothetical protein
MGVFSVCCIVGVWIVTTGTTVAQSLRFKFGLKVMQNDVMDEIQVPAFSKKWRGANRTQTQKCQELRWEQIGA